MGVLSNLEPASVFYYFEEICSIPHTSHHEKALSDYCVQFAKAHGLACRQDEMGNVLIKAPATPGYEKEPGLILQGHLDMVGDKTADCPLDLEKDAIHPVVDGGYVCAEGTTLGGDDGIAVAYALAVLDAKDISHPALEVVLTVAEQVQAQDSDHDKNAREHDQMRIAADVRAASRKHSAPFRSGRLHTQADIAQGGRCQDGLGNTHRCLDDNRGEGVR